MTAAKVRETVVIAVCHTCNLPADAAERDVLIAAAQIIRSCSIDELLAISETSPSTGDLWGAIAMAEAEIDRRKKVAAGLRNDRPYRKGSFYGNTGTPTDSKRGTPSR